MKKIKYYYNTHSLRYEKFEETLRIKVWRVVGFLSAAVVFAFIIVFLAYTYLDSPKEKALKREIAQLQMQYDLLNENLNQIQTVLIDLADRDDNIYRVIFEAEPIDASQRNAGFGGSNRYAQLEGFQNSELLITTAEKLDKIKKKMSVQSQSYDALDKLIKQKEEMLASIPAIQPISNKDLKRIGSGFGWRIDPIYKVPRMHEGIDFSAPIGTPIYATGDGVISLVEYSDRGYGNHVVITHGFGYQSLYGHMSKIKAKIGQHVSRGDLIGYVGSSGKSTAPHCHYEVIKNGKKIDPINFFFNDLTATEYAQMLELSDRANQSFD